jgi:tRNA G18 (ribose-2'-O)-methylase SpoU
MPLLAVDDPSDPRLSDYQHVPDPELLRRGEIFVAEGRNVVRTLLAASPMTARSVLVTEAALEGLRDAIEPRLPELTVYVAPRDLMEGLTGYNLHHGCLAIGARPRWQEVGEWLRRVPGARTLIVLEQVANADNVGGVFRNAAALGADAVVLGPNCCDPLYRKAIRVSMGAALRVPVVRAGAWPDALGVLRTAGFTVAALTPHAPAVAIDAFAASWKKGGRIALLAGSEGQGLTPAALAAVDVAVRIPMAAGVDSLNVLTATGIVLQRVAGIGDRGSDSGATVIL